MIVMKFGGTSVRDAAAVDRLVEIVRRQTQPPVLVVSALAKVTDGLLQIAQLAERGDGGAAAKAVQALHRRHQ